MNRKELVSRIFVAAGIFNFVGAGLALLTQNPVMEIYPEVFSGFGLLAILLWGWAYVAVSKSFAQVRPLIFVFFVEKLVYVGSWIYWWTHNWGETSQKIYDEQFMAWFFLVGYGPGDAAFGAFFLWVFWTTKSNIENSN